MIGRRLDDLGDAERPSPRQDVADEEPDGEPAQRRHQQHLPPGKAGGGRTQAVRPGPEQDPVEEMDELAKADGADRRHRPDDDGKDGKHDLIVAGKPIEP